MGRASRGKKERKAEFEAELEMRDALLADRDAKITALTERIAQLEEYLRGLVFIRKRRAGDSEGQGLLFESATSPAEGESDIAEEEDEDEGDDDPPPSPSRRKRSRRGKPDLSCLPTEEVLHELPESERICPETGVRLVPIGEKVTEELHFEPAKLILRIHRHVIYGPAPGDAVDRQIRERCAAGPTQVIEDCIASAALLGWLLTQKYLHHLPLYRQESIFEREGLRIPRSTLSDWVLRSAELLEPIATCLYNKVRAGPVMQLDDTPVQCQRGRGEKNYQAYLWTIVNPDVSGVVYRFTAGRSSELIVDVFELLEGYAVGDGYSGHKAAARIAASLSEELKRIRMGGCWAHVTRKFKDAASEAAKTAKLFRKDIKALYAIDEDAQRQAEERKLSHEEHLALRLQLRRERAPKILLRIYRRARKLRKEDRFGDAGKMDKALKYVVNQRAALSRFLADARIPLDNNRCERAIRPLAIGRRNWLFAGSERGGKAAAVIYTLIESCKIAKVNPQAYLADVLVRISTHPASRIEELLPSNWTELRRRKARAAA